MPRELARKAGAGAPARRRVLRSVQMEAVAVLPDVPSEVGRCVDSGCACEYQALAGAST